MGNVVELEMTDADVSQAFNEMTEPDRFETDATSAVMTEHEAAAYIGVGVSWLRNNRRAAFTPPYLKYGSKTIRYRRSVLDEWMLAQEVN